MFPQQIDQLLELPDAMTKDNTEYKFIGWVMCTCLITAIGTYSPSPELASLFISATFILFLFCSVCTFKVLDNSKKRHQQYVEQFLVGIQAVTVWSKKPIHDGNTELLWLCKQLTAIKEKKQCIPKHLRILMIHQVFEVKNKIICS